MSRRWAMPPGSARTACFRFACRPWSSSTVSARQRGTRPFACAPISPISASLSLSRPSMAMQRTSTQLENLLEPLHETLGFIQMLLQPGPEIAIGCLADHFRQGLDNLVLSMEKVLQAVREERVE